MTDNSKFCISYICTTGINLLNNVLFMDNMLAVTSLGSGIVPAPSWIHHVGSHVALLTVVDCSVNSSSI